MFSIWASATGMPRILPRRPRRPVPTCVGGLAGRRCRPGRVAFLGPSLFGGGNPPLPCAPPCSCGCVAALFARLLAPAPLLIQRCLGFLPGCVLARVKLRVDVPVIRRVFHSISWGSGSPLGPIPQPILRDRTLSSLAASCASRTIRSASRNSWSVIALGGSPARTDGTGIEALINKQHRTRTI